jgi:putative NIF3 family GTP cyclohydrolase 1 type 2
MKGRLEPLFAADLSLAAYHLPLDAHPDVGNNALLCELLGFERAEPFADHRGRPVGFVGRSPAGKPLGELVQRLTSELGRAPLVQGAGPDPVRSIGIVSGGAPEHLRDAIAAGLDAYLTGEPAEWAMAEATEAGVHFIAAGHYATETLGVRRLGELLTERFGVEHRFLDLPNPV